MKKNPNKCLTFKGLSLLLSYPAASWILETAAIVALIEQENLLSKSLMSALETFVQRFQTRDEIDLQTEYVALFDQTRQVSLHLFEHIHGESRDRGQAMVDLAEVYKQHGLEIDAKELPDYLPLFLEFLATLPFSEAVTLLNECMHIIERIAAELAKKGSDYVAIFNALLAIAGRPTLSWTSRPQAGFDLAAAERFDKEWEEEEIKFLGNKACANASPAISEAIHHIDVSSITTQSHAPLDKERK